ncbi:MAG: HAMP domain-containing sensor histidine kinase, partial [Polyangiales bacterium]
MTRAPSGEMKLKNKLTLVVVCVTWCALAGSFALVPLLVRRDETEDLDRALARQAVKAVARGEVSDGWVEIPEMLDAVRRHVAIYAPDGTLLHATSSFEGGAPPFEDLGVSLPLPAEGVAVNSGKASQMLRGIVMEVPGSDKVLLYAVSRSAIDHDLAFLYRTLGLLLFGSTLLVVLVARWLGERLARDVGAIAAVARNVAQGDLHARAGAEFDTRELADLAADLDHMISQLDALVAAQRRFVSHAAHELRSPLSTLRGELQLALRRPRDEAGYRHSLEQALLDVEALVALTEDLLTLARVQADPTRSEQAVLAEAMHEAVRQTRRKADLAAVHITVRPRAPDSEPTVAAIGETRVHGRTPEIARALRNLLDNAIAHSQAEGRIFVEHWRAGEQVWIAIRDQG